MKKLESLKEFKLNDVELVNVSGGRGDLVDAGSGAGVVKTASGTYSYSSDFINSSGHVIYQNVLRIAD